MKPANTGPRVLIVDDSPINIELARFVLEDADFTIAALADGTALVETIADFRPQLILMDIQLPGRDGLELTRMIKADPTNRSIKVVAFTAHAMKGDEERMRDAGCDGYISKPIDVATFAEQVDGFLGPGDRLH